MRNLSVQTLAMFFVPFYKFRLDHDPEDLLETYTEMMDLVAGAGYEAVDVTTWEVAALGLTDVARILKERGLSVSSLICPSSIAMPDDEGISQRVEELKKCADLCAALGSHVFMIVPQAHPGIEAMSREEIHAAMERHLSPVAEYAAGKGLVTVIEDTPDLKLHLCSMTDLDEVLAAVPQLRLIYDSANMILTGEDPVEFLRHFAGRIGYVHLKDIRPALPGAIVKDIDENGKEWSTAPSGFGVVNLHAVCDELKEQGYDGGVTVEFAVDDDRNFARSLNRSREYAENLII